MLGKGAQTVFYRSVSAAEYSSWQQFGVLGTRQGHYETGKCLTISPELAAEWWRMFVMIAWETFPGYLLKITFPVEVASSISLLGEHIDGIGPAYFATLKQMEHAKIEDVAKLET